MPLWIKSVYLVCEVLLRELELSSTPQKVEEGTTVAVFGLGGIGLSVIQRAKLAKQVRLLVLMSIQINLKWQRNLAPLILSIKRL